MLSVLAEATPPPPAQNNFGDDMSNGMAGPMALLIIVLLAIATVLLIRNMNRRLRRLPASFPIRGADGSVQRDGGTSRDRVAAGPDRAPEEPPGDSGGDGGARVG
jgi:hypothetical protein